MPLTHYERTQKFASSGYGTNKQRVKQESQYRIGQCALTTQRLEGKTALCSPSGNLYSESAILEYLLEATRSLKQQTAAFAAQKDTQANEAIAKQDEASRKRLADFKESQEIVKKSKSVVTSKPSAKEDLQRVSYWLSAAQPTSESSAASTTKPPLDRPPSPITGAPLRRKDLWPVQLERNNDDDDGTLVCAVSSKSLERGSPSVLAFWTHTKGSSSSGTLALASVLESVVEQGRCPVTDRKIRHVRTLYASGQACERKQHYKPTIT